MAADPSLPVSSSEADRSPSIAAAWLRRLGLIIGLGLIITAVVVLLRQQDVLSAALAAIRRPAPGYLVLLLAGVAANVVLTGIMFSLLMSRYGRVGLLEMQALIAAATLVNYLPLRPGLPGRIAYHKGGQQNPGEPLGQDDRPGLTAQPRDGELPRGGHSPHQNSGWITLLDLVRRAGWTDPALARGLIRSITPRLAAGGIGALRRGFLCGRCVYYAAFKLIGLPLSRRPTRCCFACVSMIATMVPFVSNGLGLREWAVGLTSPLLAVGRLEQGITAELVNRAAEMAVVSSSWAWPVWPIWPPAGVHMLANHTTRHDKNEPAAHHRRLCRAGSVPLCRFSDYTRSVRLAASRSNTPGRDYEEYRSARR